MNCYQLGSSIVSPSALDFPFGYGTYMCISFQKWQWKSLIKNAAVILLLINSLIGFITYQNNNPKLLSKIREFSTNLVGFNYFALSNQKYKYQVTLFKDSKKSLKLIMWYVNIMRWLSLFLFLITFIFLNLS